MLSVNRKLNECSEFERLGFDSPQNLTDFNTRVIWCSSVLRTSFHEYLEKLNKTLPALQYSKDEMSLLPVCCRTTVIRRVNFSPKFYSLSSSENNQSPGIWRPFSTESASPNTPTTTKNIPDITEEINLSRMTFSGHLPVILPSFVKIGQSTSSVFKAVKRRKHQCQFCDICFINGGQLAAHIRVHTGLKPYQCEHHGCSRSFARNEELTRHCRIHSGDKPHQCNVCKKRFGRKDHLNKHRKTHLKASEKKVYLCKVSGCGHKYTRSDALTRHLNTAHFIKHVRGQK